MTNKPHAATEIYLINSPVSLKRKRTKQTKKYTGGLRKTVHWVKCHVSVRTKAAWGGTPLPPQRWEAQAGRCLSSANQCGWNEVQVQFERPCPKNWEQLKKTPVCDLWPPHIMCTQCTQLLSRPWYSIIKFLRHTHTHSGDKGTYRPAWSPDLIAGLHRVALWEPTTKVVFWPQCRHGGENTHHTWHPK